jgi:hypothetical protein
MRGAEARRELRELGKLRRLREQYTVALHYSLLSYYNSEISRLCFPLRLNSQKFTSTTKRGKMRTS